MICSDRIQSSPRQSLSSTVPLTSWYVHLSTYTSINTHTNLCILKDTQYITANSQIESPHHFIDRSISFFDRSSYELVRSPFDLYIYKHTYTSTTCAYLNTHSVSLPTVKPNLAAFNRPLNLLLRRFLLRTGTFTYLLIHLYTHIHVYMQYCLCILKYTQYITANSQTESPPLQLIAQSLSSTALPTNWYVHLYRYVHVYNLCILK